MKEDWPDELYLMTNLMKCGKQVIHIRDDILNFFGCGQKHNKSFNNETADYRGSTNQKLKSRSTAAKTNDDLTTQKIGKRLETPGTTDLITPDKYSKPSNQNKNLLNKQLFKETDDKKNISVEKSSVQINLTKKQLTQIQTSCHSGAVNTGICSSNHQTNQEVGKNINKVNISSYNKNAMEQRQEQTEQQCTTNPSEVEQTKPVEAKPKEKSTSHKKKSSSTKNINIKSKNLVEAALSNEFQDKENDVNEVNQK